MSGVANDNDTGREPEGAHPLWNKWRVQGGVNRDNMRTHATMKQMWRKRKESHPQGRYCTDKRKYRLRASMNVTLKNSGWSPMQIIQIKP